MLFIKNMLKQPLTKQDAIKLVMHNIKSPPLSNGLLESTVNAVGKNGMSLIDWWRTRFQIIVGEITTALTWEQQRERLIAHILTERGWQSVYSVTKDFKAVDTWAHLVSENEIFSGKSKEIWTGLILQIFITSALTDACLSELGVKYFRLDTVKITEVKLFGEYEKEIKALDINVNDAIRQKVESFQDADAFAIADLKDKVVNPIINEQYRLLRVMREQIIHGTLDVLDVGERMNALQAKKAEIAAAVTT
jgi:hypothetical protein